MTTEWDKQTFTDCVEPIRVDRGKQVKTREYLSSGKYPVVDQGQGLVAGWTDSEAAVIRDGLPYVVFGDHTRIFKYVDFPFALGADGTKLIKPKDDISPLYFYFYLLVLNIPSRGYSRHYRLLKEKEISLPPLPEQKKMAAVLLKIQRAIETQEKIIQSLRDLKKSTTQHVFTRGLRDEKTKMTEIGEIPEGWEVATCEDVADKITVGIVVRPASYYVRDGVPAFRSLNVREDRLVPDDLVYISQADNDGKLVKSKLRVGDILVVRTGYPGTSCVVPKDYEGANCIDLVIVRPKDDRLLSHFLSRFFNSEAGKRHAFAAKTGLAQQHLNVGAVRCARIPLPSLDEQTDITNALVSVDRKLLWHESKKSALQDLFKTTLNKLMTGRIRVTDLDIDMSEVEG
ncbi:MAG: restriction endonuclease subunit S [Anaerolineae bacterium]|nr:restriction endonuclease subunit S [Anaerolineae bacterium]